MLIILPQQSLTIVCLHLWACRVSQLPCSTTVSACFCAVYRERNSPTHAGDANHLEFHSDQGATDLIALLSISAAKEGGESLLVSAIAIHNELLRRGRKVGPLWCLRLQRCPTISAQFASLKFLEARVLAEHLSNHYRCNNG